MDLFRNSARRRRLKAYYRHHQAQQRAVSLPGLISVEEIQVIENSEPIRTPETLSEKAWHLFARSDWSNLLALKKKAKKGWKALGFSEYEVRTIEENIS